MSLSDKDIASFKRTPVPAVLPNVRVADPSLQKWIEAVNALIGMRLVGQPGNLADKAITYREQFDAGLIKIVSGDTTMSGRGAAPIIPTNGGGPNDNLPPPAPTGLQATGGLTTILLQWDEFDRNRVAYAEVWSAGTDNLGAAVLIGTSTGRLYADAVGTPGVTRYYWVRFIAPGSLKVPGPYNAVAGTAGETGTDAAAILDLLTGQLTESQLATVLAARINLIDAPATTAMSVNQRIQAGDDALSQQIALLTAGANQTFDQFKLWPFDASAEGWTAINATLAWVAGWLTYTSPSGVVSLTSPTLTGAEIVNGSAYQQVRFRIKRTAGTGWAVSLRFFRGSNWYSVSVPDPVVAIGESDSALVDLSGNADWIGQTITRLELQLDSATGSVYEVDWVAVGRDGPAASFAALQQEITARANEDTALAQSITTLSATVDGKASTVALQEEASVRASADGSLTAQKFVKIDINGFVTGYGIAASDNGPTGTPESEFIVRANRFAVVPPTGGTGAGAPFFFQASATTINGVAVAPGLYVASAFIANGSIGTAKIGLLQVDDARIASMSVAKLLAGSISVDEYIQSTGYVPDMSGWRINGNGVAEFAAASIRGQLTVGQFDSRGLIVRAPDGTALFGAGVPLDWAQIIGQPTGIYNANITLTPQGQLLGAGGGQVSLGGLGAGALAYINQITEGNAATYLGPLAISRDFVALGTLTGDRFTTNLRTDQSTLLRNADFTEYTGTNSGIEALAGWTLYAGTVPSNWLIRRSWNGGAIWNVGRGGALLFYNQVGYPGEWGIYQRVQVQEGVTYEVHVSGSAHRTNGRIAISWFNSSQAFLSQASVPIAVDAGVGQPMAPPIIAWGSVVAPAGAVQADIYLIAGAASAGDSFLFLHRAHFAPLVEGASATNPTPWRPAGVVEIHGGALTAETITADKMQANLFSSNNVLTRNLTVRDASGNVIFGAGTNLDWSRIANQPGGIFNSNISINSAGQLSGAGGGQVTLGGLGAGAFATLSQITAGNAPTFIAGAAIGNALIGNSIFSNDFNGSVEPNGTITNDGTTGWIIGKAGRAVFSDVKVRGDVEATSINGQPVTTATMPPGAITYNVVASPLNVVAFTGNAGTASFFTDEVELPASSFADRWVDFSANLGLIIIVNHPGTALNVQCLIGLQRSLPGGSWDTFSQQTRLKVDRRTIWKQNAGSLAVNAPLSDSMSDALSSAKLGASMFRFRASVAVALFDSDWSLLSDRITSVTYSGDLALYERKR